ncbi:MAG: type IV pilus assembly protein PilM [Armatimonadetes bacterium]|nr:type IV pilus assembly protein PilM [Armatimonadota bacterium]
MPTKQKTRSITHRVGLDIGSHSVKGVEVVERGAEIVIRAARSTPIPGFRSKADPPDHSSVVQAVKTLWAAAGFGTNAVVLALPAESVYIKWLHLEASNPDELDITARAAAVRGAPFPADDAIVDYRVMTSHGRTGYNVHFVMLVAASATAVDSLLNVAESAGLEPIAVDVGTVAALRSFDAQKKSSSTLWSGQPLAHCILGAKSTTITVIRGGELEFARTVPVGGSDFTERIAEHLSITWQEAERIKISPGSRLLENGTMVTSHNSQEVRIPCDSVVARLAREIRRSLRFFTSQYAEGSYLGMIGSTTIGGGGALLRGLDTCLEQQGIEINGTVNPFAGFSVDAEGGLQIGDTASQFETAMGLAIADYAQNASVQMEMDFAA